MVDSLHKILIVDDNPDNCELLEDIFDETYDVSIVYSGVEALDVIKNNSFDIVLLDVNMPGMDGYEVCRRVKADPHSALIPIVFVSALASIEERLRGYEAGADDYVTKPFKEEEIEDVVTRVLKQRIQTKEFEQQGKEAMKTAFQAMSNSAELGNIIRFFQTSYDCHNNAALAQELLATTDVFGLRCCIKMNGKFKAEFFGCDEGSIEAKVLQHFSENEKVLDFGARTLINADNVSLLIRNMPLDRPDDYGRIKDNLVVLVNGTEARLKALDLESKVEDERNRGIQSVLIKGQDKLSEIRTIVAQQKHNTEEVADTLNTKIESIIFSLGLDEDQEKTILDAVDKGVEGLNGLLHFSAQVEESFLGFVSDLDKLVQQ